MRRLWSAVVLSHTVTLSVHFDSNTQSCPRLASRIPSHRVPHKMSRKTVTRSRSISKRISGLWSSKLPALITEPSRAVIALPMDLLHEIADHLPEPDTLALSSCSTELRTLLLPKIYAAVSLLCGSKACSSKLEILSQSPKLCGFIRTLDVGPDWLSWPIEASVELEVASVIGKMSSGLTNLETFTWCGIHPLPDNVWGALRKSCPRLRNLSYMTEIREFEPESQLFKFRNLLEFTLWVKDKDKAEAAPLIRPNLPPQLGDMLLENPVLEHLSLRLCASQNNLVPLLPLFQGTWKNLSSFHIELCIDHPARSELAPFLAAHPQITSLSIFPHLPDTSPLQLDVDALPCLEYFSGVSQQLYALPHVGSLRELVLQDRDVARDAAILLAVLPHVISLTSLTMAFGNADSADTISTLCDITVTCSNLESVNITYHSPCTMKRLKAISVVLSRLQFLYTLTITKTYRITDGTMLSAALLLLEHNPGLRCIRLVWVTIKQWKQSGNYTVIPLTVNSVEVPDMLDAKEFGPRTLGGSFNRDFRYALRGGDRVSKGIARMRR
ncbi:hypothetical protein MVEN_00706500 [Mycena venus]|uniref:F-box domain-containing protein n=1 Tax=Mycena venus TaxID=2733690 RepID=A0A8H6YHE6_9AGAR|nr:hypothetical protein MVEN_00706500 [Mycena venus]